MGQIADKMINGEICALCGVSLGAGEWVYLQHADESETARVQMPEDGEPMGVPVICNDCNTNR